MASLSASGDVMHHVRRMWRPPLSPLLLSLLLFLVSLLLHDLVHAARVPIKINRGPAPVEPSHPATTRSQRAGGSAPSLASPLPTSRPPAPFALPPPLLRVLHLEGAVHTDDGEEQASSRQQGGSSGEDDDEDEMDLRFDEAYDEAVWRQLDGSCLSTTPPLSRYAYTLCPYHNVTQQETMGSFRAVLGSPPVHPSPHCPGLSSSVFPSPLLSCSGATAECGTAGN